MCSTNKNTNKLPLCKLKSGISISTGENSHSFWFLFLWIFNFYNKNKHEREKRNFCNQIYTSRCSLFSLWKKNERNPYKYLWITFRWAWEVRNIKNYVKRLWFMGNKRCVKRCELKEWDTKRNKEEIVKNKVYNFIEFMVSVISKIQTIFFYI